MHCEQVPRALQAEQFVGHASQTPYSLKKLASEHSLQVAELLSKTAQLFLP
jgi:hypothetical protein